MINSKVVMNNSWKDVQELAKKLAKVIETRTKMQELTDVEYNKETEFIFERYHVLGSRFEGCNEMYQRQHIDEYFTELFNELIIEYVTGKKPETDNSEEDEF